MTLVDAGRRHGWILALFGGAALWVLLLGHPLEIVERRLLDLALSTRAAVGRTPPADPRVVILALDDTDLASMPSLEEEYNAAADLIRQAGELGAALVVFDTIYVRGTQRMAEPVLQALARGPPVVLAEALRSAPGENNEVVRLRSFPSWAERKTRSGLINIEPDADGTYRAYSLLHWNGVSFEPSLAFAAWFAARGLDWAADVTQPRPGVVRWLELSADGQHAEQRELAPASEGTRLLNLRGSWREGAGFAHLSLRGLHDLHRKHAAGDRPLAGKFLFFAYVATGVADLGATALGPNEPLVLLHASAFNDLLQGSSFFRAGRWLDALALLGLTLPGLAMSLLQRKAALLLLWLLGSAGIATLAVAVLLHAHLLVSAGAMLGLWTVAIVVEIGRRHSLAIAERRRIRDTMSLYFSPRILSDVLANPGRLEPRRAEITVLLTDLRNSTDLAEKLGAEGMLHLLNSIFAVENQAVFAEEGSMEKPVGDQFLAYWGAPDPQSDGADRALRAALALISGLQDLRKTFAPEVRTLFGYGVALHAGRSLIGNIGSAQFYHYGPVGDLLNATARIESLTKFYGVLVLVTRDLYDRFTKAPEARILDRVVVKGKTSSLELLELRNPSSPENFAEIANSYAEAYAAYQAGEFERAGKLFERTSSSDKPSAVMAARCRELQSNPPEEWKGAYTFLAK